MITRDDISRETFFDILKRGQDLYKRGGIHDFHIEEDDLGGYVLTARASNQQYKPKIGIDEEEEEIFDYSCTCSRAGNWGMCMHCVALSFYYLNKRDKGELDYKFPRKSTRGLLPVLQGYVRKASLEMYYENRKEAKVRIQPVFVFPQGDSDKVELSFRLGKEKLYVVKDINQFLEHVDTGQKYAYGKELEFVHAMDAFDENARQWIRFMINTLSYKGENYYYYSKQRELKISGQELEQAIEILPSEKFQAKLKTDKKAEEWCYTKEKPKLTVKLSGNEEGAVLTVDMPPMLYGKTNVFFWKDKKLYCLEREKLEPLKVFLDYLNKNYYKEIFIAKNDLQVFVEELLPLLEEVMEVTKENFYTSAYIPPIPDYKFYISAPRENTIMCKNIAVYAYGEYNIYEKDETQPRNRKDENRLKYQISPFFNAFSPKEKELVITGEEDLIYDFLTEGLDFLRSLGEVFVSDEIKKIQVRRTTKLQVGLSMEGNLMEMTINSPELPLNQLAEILSKYNRKKKYYRLKDGSFIQVEGGSLDTLLQMKQDMKLTDAQIKGGKIELPAYRALYLDHMLKDVTEGLYAVRDKRFRALIRNMKTVEESDFEVPTGLNEILRSYQKTGFRWLKTLQNNGFGAILADDMGLGKTIQAITLLVSQYQEIGKGALIICPASLVYNWKKEIETFAPELPVELVTGNGGERKQILEQYTRDKVLITSYDLLRRDIEWYEGIKFGIEIIDEAQNIKNHTTQAAKAVKVVQAEFKLALTGTPIENRLSELWSIFDYLMPGFLYGYQQFRKDLEAPIVQRQDRRAMEKLQKMISPFVLRRTKKEVLKDLPDKIEKTITAQFEGEQLKLYKAHVQRLKLMLENQSEEEFKSGKIQVLAELTRLRQVCCDPALIYEDYQGESAKLEMCMEYLQNAVSGDHKILLFSQFTTMLARLQDKMGKEGISFYTLTGSTPKEERMELVERFNRDDTNVFCISLKAGGTGLNLTSADIVIHYDPWWNVAVQNQATDRAHRIGQKNVVNVYKMVIKDTIEENIMKLQEKKQRLAEEILSGDQISGAAFTKEELLELLG